MKQIFLACLLGILLLSANGFCFVLEGNSAIEESNGTKITVTPHTATSLAKKIEQSFSFENLTDSSLSGIRPVLIFSDNPKVSLEKRAEDVYETVEMSKSFDTTKYLWNQTKSGDPKNLYKIKVWQYIRDANSLTNANRYKIMTIWEQNVKSVGACAGQPKQIKCFYWDEKQLASKKGWETQSLESLGEIQINGESARYYYGEELSIEPGQTVDWKINYSPKKAEGKWTLAFIQGEPSCLADNSCSNQWVLDPWWNSNWNSRYPINSLVIQNSLHSNNWINLQGVDFSGLDMACADAADLTIVNEPDGVEVTDLNFQGWNGTNTDTNVNVLFKLTEAMAPGTYNGEYYFYTKNDACAAPANRTIDQADFDDFEDGDITANPAWTISEGGSITTTVEASAAKEGNYGVKIVAPSGKYVVYNSYEIANSQKKPPYQFCAWMKTSDASMNMRYRAVCDYEGQEFIMGIDADKFYGSSGAVDYRGWKNMPSNNTWYKFCVNNDGTEVTVTIYDASENFMESWKTTSIRTGTLSYIGFYLDNTQIGATSYLDNVGFEIPKSPSYSIGTEEGNDLDGDGVMDHLDECLETPYGEKVDAVGCSCSQKTCDDDNPCTDDACDFNTAECGFANDNTNVCGFERDCTGSTCILKETPPYFFWKLFPEDGHDYCLEGTCTQYGCDLISEDFNADCSFSGTGDLEARVEELEGKVTQLEQQNLDLQSQMSLLEASVNAVKSAFESFVSLVDAYMFSLPKGLKEGMVCEALKQSGETSAESFGLSCTIEDNGNCKCIQI